MEINAPENLNELAEVLQSYDMATTFLIAGGTDLINKIRENKCVDYNIVDLTKLEAMKGIEDKGCYIKIGALTTMTDIIQNECIKTHLTALYQAAYELGSTIIRNVATIGGNIANASQSADVVLTLFAYDADVVIMNQYGDVRRVAINELVIGRNMTSLKCGEVILEIHIPKERGVSVFKKIGSRKTVTISKLSCALYSFSKDGSKHVRIYLGAIGVVPTRAVLLEQLFLESQNPDLNQLSRCAYDEVEKAIPQRSSKYYKRVAIQGLMEDVLKEFQHNAIV
ncbi:FAD binding domain-containing protein [Peptoniphilus equinus]|uniref:FAD binding domain-containing protein n=1 Tax=Peptoniphilus equinus TaxID=3016343 RepID=A0ABY7QT77_9FIRM|nr:FAD binding domain-containing protein [Peptoniphilus equinus]WBW49998.1 FAD binding domain-containing protein [Peptoniphilus equinus]